MKVVIDTNVLVSGVYFGGAPAKIIDAWLNKSFLVFITPTIINEYLRALDYLSSKKRPVLNMTGKFFYPKFVILYLMKKSQ